MSWNRSLTSRHAGKVRSQALSHHIDERPDFRRGMPPFLMHDMDWQGLWLVLFEHELQLARRDDRRHLIRQQPRDAKAAHRGLDRRIIRCHREPWLNS